MCMSRRQKPRAR